MSMLRQSWYMMFRHLTNLWRQPIWIAVTLVQPIIWLLLYGALFKSVVKMPGFHSGSYIQFLAPGIVIMTALFSSGWSGMAVIDDIDKGVTDRLSRLANGARLADSRPPDAGNRRDRCAIAHHHRAGDRRWRALPQRVGRHRADRVRVAARCIVRRTVVRACARRVAVARRRSSL